MHFLFSKSTEFDSFGTWRKPPSFADFLQRCVESTFGVPVIFSDKNRFGHELTWISGTIEGEKEAFRISFNSA
jgi:hypothetical protein